MLKTSSILALIGLVFAGPVAGDSVSMVQVEDLRQEAETLRREQLVLVLEFSSEYCSFCRKMEELFLLPMQRNEDYSTRILIRSVSLDAYETLIDFDGRFISTQEFASRYDVSFTPTLLFLDADGVELSERLVGIWSEDFYGVYIDERIDAARGRL